MLKPHLSTHIQSTQARATFKMEETSSVAVLAMLSIFALVGIFGNSLVLYIYANKKIKTTAGIFIMCLAGTDLFTCLIIVPFTEVVIYLKYKLQYDVLCQAKKVFDNMQCPILSIYNGGYRSG